MIHYTKCYEDPTVHNIRYFPCNENFIYFKLLIRHPDIIKRQIPLLSQSGHDFVSQTVSFALGCFRKALTVCVSHFKIDLKFIV